MLGKETRRVGDGMRKCRESTEKEVAKKWGTERRGLKRVYKSKGRCSIR